MPHDEVVVRVAELSRDRLSALLAEGEASGYRFLRRLIDEWEGGVSRFSRTGEALFAAGTGGRLVGVCGLSIDPYLDDPRVGRVRNVYVLAEHRRRGVGRRLVEAAIASAAGHFDLLRLRGRSRACATLRIARLPGVSRDSGLHAHHGVEVKRPRATASISCR